MRRGVRIAAWIAVFAACAGVGAFVASRTDPFPPGVEDPGARPTPGDPAPTPVDARYAVAAGATTRHDLFVGGSCVTDWNIGLRFAVDHTRAVTGSGAARLEGTLRCGFTTAQTQARRIPLRVHGHLRDGLLVLRLRVVSVLPTGSDDFGGLRKTLGRFPEVPLRAGTGRVTGAARLSDGDRGAYVAVYHVRVTQIPR